MKDNGLIRYYKEQYGKNNGRLHLQDYPFKLKVEHQQGYGDVNTMYDGGRKYFYKDCEYHQADAEILLSQIYADLGMKTAIYTPITQDAVISNSILTPTTEEANTFFRAKIEAEKHIFPQFMQKLIDDTERGYAINVIYKKLSQYQKHFTDKGLSDYLKMRVLDATVKNPDRHFGNFFVNKNEQGLADGVVLIDYDAAGYPYRSSTYYSLLNGAGLDERSTIINYFKREQEIQSYVNTNQLAEDLGKIEVSSIVQDVKQTIGYKIDDKFVSEVATSINETAEMLIK